MAIDMLDSFFERHKGARRLLLLWAICMMSWVIIQVFSDPSQITASVATALGIVVGLLTPVLLFYQWMRAYDDGTIMNHPKLEEHKDKISLARRDVN